MREYAVVSGCYEDRICVSTMDYLVVRSNVRALQEWISEVKGKCGP